MRCLHQRKDGTCDVGFDSGVVKEAAKEAAKKAAKKVLKKVEEMAKEKWNSWIHKSVSSSE